MKDLEKQIEEAGFQYNKRLYNPEVSSEEAIYINLEDAFIEGAKSEAAKQYWQQGMYSEEDMLNFSFWLLNNIGETSNDRVAHFDNHHYLNKWLEQNKKK